MRPTQESLVAGLRSHLGLAGLAFVLGFNPFDIIPGSGVDF